MVVDDAVKEVRPFLVCFLVRNVDLSSGDVLKRFIQVQTRLHDGVCQKRVAATIATHDLAKIPAGKVSNFCLPFIFQTNAGSLPYSRSCTLRDLPRS